MTAVPELPEEDADAPQDAAGESTAPEDLAADDDAVFAQLVAGFDSPVDDEARSWPATSGGRKRRFCASLPNITTGLRPKMFMWMAEAPLMPAPDSLMTCIISAASVTPSPAPP